MTMAGGPIFVGDTYTNLVSSLGTGKDKVEGGKFTWRLIGRQELLSMYECDWLAGKIIDAPADDQTREWRLWNAGHRQERAIMAEERRLDVRGAVNRAMKMGALFGGGCIVIGTDDADQAAPLEVESIKKGGVKFLHALSRWEIWAAQLDRNPLSPTFGHPVYYELHTPTQGAVQVHPSRVIRFLGQQRLEMAYTYDGWGFSKLQRVYESVRNAASVGGCLAGLAQEAKVDIIKVPQLTARVQDKGYRDAIMTRFGLANQTKSLVNAVLLDAEEEWNQKTINPRGWPEAIHTFLEIAAGSADMPVTRLLGVAPKGLNATGESDLRNYYDMLAARQEVELRPVLAKLDEAIIRSALGARPAEVDYEWKPLWQMTEAERAGLNLQKAQTADIHGTLGALPPSALSVGIQNDLVQGDVYPGLEDALAEAKAKGEAPAPLIAPDARVETTSARANASKVKS